MPGKKPKERQRYMLRVNDTLVEVTRAVYLAWYQDVRDTSEYSRRNREAIW